MFSKLRSLIFKIDPETAHNIAIKALKLNFLPEYKKILESEEILNCKLFGKKINNPIGLAAGFDKSAEAYNSLFKLGFGFVEVGTVTPIKQYGNPKPRIFRLEEDEALINRLGFNNSGSDKIRERLLNQKPLGLLGVNIGPNKESKNRSNDYLECLRKFHDISDYLTINISSPNTENLRDFHEEYNLDELLKKIQDEKKKIKSEVPIALKVSPDIKDSEIESIVEICIKNNIEALIISNTTDKERDDLIGSEKYQKGGLSGKPIEKKTNLIINKFFNLLKGKIIIIGVGGVDSGITAYNKILAGANFVQLYTGMIFKGPGIVREIKKDLIKLLKRDGIKNIKELVGKKIP